MPKIITAQQAALHLEVSDRRVRQLVDKGEIKTLGRFGRTIVLSKASVLRLKKARGEAAEARRRASQVPAEPAQPYS